MVGLVQLLPTQYQLSQPTPATHLQGKRSTRTTRRVSSGGSDADGRRNWFASASAGSVEAALRDTSCKSPSVDSARYNSGHLTSSLTGSLTSSRNGSSRDAALTAAVPTPPHPSPLADPAAAASARELPPLDAIPATERLQHYSPSVYTPVTDPMAVGRVDPAHGIVLSGEEERLTAIERCALIMPLDQGMQLPHPCRWVLSTQTAPRVSAQAGRAPLCQRPACGVPQQSAAMWCNSSSGNKQQDQVHYMWRLPCRLHNSCGGIVAPDSRFEAMTHMLMNVFDVVRRSRVPPCSAILSHFTMSLQLQSSALHMACSSWELRPLVYLQLAIWP